MTTPQPAALPEDELRALYQRHELATTGLVLSDFKRIVSEAIALQPQPAAAVSDADVWELWLRVCAESENLSTRVMIANFARAILALRPQAESEQEKELRRSLDEAQATISQRNAEVIELHKRIQRSPQAVPIGRDDLKVLMSAAGYVHATAQEKADFINGFRNAEAHRGITAQGAQGGEG